MSELLYRIALTKIQGIGAITAKQLVQKAGSATKIFHATKAELSKIAGTHTVNQILIQEVMDWANKELAFIQKNNIKVSFFDGADYPERLKQTRDAPFILYAQGTMDLNAERVVAIVGTRTPTQRGIEICKNLVSGLKIYNPLIVSGLAYGIDITAHQQAVAIGLGTIGVMGNGLQRIYPREHAPFTKSMLEKGGLLTEFPSDQDPEREHFPMRNRIIAGLCDALIVIESARKGGSMISALYANDYNKAVFAVPGRIGDPFAAGCHHLIKTHQAHILESAADVGYIMGWEASAEKEKTSVGLTAKPLKKGIHPPLFTSHLTESEQQIINLLQSNESISIDQIRNETNMNHSQLAGLLLNLELNGLIRTLPGRRYAKI